MGAGISPMGMNMPQQPQGQGKGGGGRSAFNQQMMNVPGFADSLQASQQRMAQDPNANMMRTQPALPNAMNPVAQLAQPQSPMSIDDFARSGLMGPTTQEFRKFIEFEGSMRDPALVSAYQRYTGGDQERIAQMRMEQMRMQQERQSSFDALNQARQAGLQVGPTPGQPPNPYASMSIPQRQQMNEQIRMQQMMQQRQMPFQMQPRINNPMFGGLGALMAMRGFGGGFGQPMGGGFGGFSQPQFGGGFRQPMRGFGGGFGGFSQPQFGGGFRQPMRGFNQPQMSNPFGASMGRGLGGLMGFFR